MRVIVQKNDGTELFRYQTDTAENESCLAPAKADVGDVVESLLEGARFLGVSPVAEPASETPPAPDLTLTPG